MDSSNAANGAHDESFYGVFLDTDFEVSGTPKVYTSFKETLSAVKSNKTARFKLFKSATEAERFSVLGQETPTIQIDKITSNVPSSNTFKSLKSEDIVAFRRLIEGGEIEKVKLAVSSNPRFLVSSGDTPSIVHEGSRYNSMHVAARYDQPEIVQFIMECVTSSEFIKSLYGVEQSYLSRSEIITDLYLNTPDKAANDTPLHIASKFGHVNVVRQLVSYDKCILTPLNKHNETPKDVICSRENKEMYNDILNLLENGYFVPMWKSDDDCVQPKIGRPFSPKSPTIFPTQQNESPKILNPTFEIRAVAGPMNESQALKFWKDWKSPVRKTLLSPSPHKSPLSPKRNELRIKNIEKAGRDLAEKKKVGWAEYWPFLDKIVDLKSDSGLDLLENYLRERFSYHTDTPEKLHTSEANTLLSPMGELCKALESMRIGSMQKGKSTRRSTLVSYTCLVKSCKVLGDRLSKVIVSECKNMHGIESLANRLCHEVRHLLVLEDSFYSDSRFDSNIQGKIHGKVAENLCLLLINNFELVMGISSIVTKLQKYYASHATGSRSEITTACLVSQMYKIIHDKSYSKNGVQCVDNEESCKQWFLAAEPCLCHIESKPRLKPKQLIWDYEQIKTPNELGESKSNILPDSINYSLSSAHERREPTSNGVGYDSDEDIFSSAPSSPCSEHSSSDESNMFYNAERDFSYLLFSSVSPKDSDHEVFDAIDGKNIDPKKYPWLYRWMYSMKDYNNINIL